MSFNIATERLRWGIIRQNMVSDETNMAWLKRSTHVGEGHKQ
jgi:hypothetical protein